LPELARSATSFKIGYTGIVNAFGDVLGTAIHIDQITPPQS
jgi:hypothetical protein